MEGRGPAGPWAGLSALTVSDIRNSEGGRHGRWEWGFSHARPRSLARKASGMRWKERPSHGLPCSGRRRRRQPALVTAATLLVTPHCGGVS